MYLSSFLSACLFLFLSTHYLSPSLDIFVRGSPSVMHLHALSEYSGLGAHNEVPPTLSDGAVKAQPTRRGAEVSRTGEAQENTWRFCTSDQSVPKHLVSLLLEEQSHCALLIPKESLFPQSRVCAGRRPGWRARNGFNTPSQERETDDARRVPSKAATDDMALVH